MATMTVKAQKSDIREDNLKKTYAFVHDADTNQTFTLYPKKGSTVDLTQLVGNVAVVSGTLHTFKAQAVGEEPNIKMVVRTIDIVKKAK